jgi:glutathione synthase/RimK-type ligase-like ATP-grasp enzyme
VSNANPPLVVIGNPENRRVSMFADAAHRLGLPPPRVIAYERLLAEPGPPGQEQRLELTEVIPPASLVRIESPGENAAVQAALIRLGSIRRGLDPVRTVTELSAAAMHGRIAGSDLWHAGFCSLLERLEKELCPLGVRWMNHPADIPVLFDKTKCQRRLASRGVNVPRPLADADEAAPSCFDEFLARLDVRGWSRVFLKLRFSSSASGVVAFERGRRGMQATTSVELVRERGEVQLFNSLRIRRYTQPADIAAIIDVLCSQCVHVEQWVPKATFAGRTFDLRIVTIGGEPRHVVMRTSRGPITNLHLGNRRGAVTEFFEKWDPHARDAAWSTCRAAAVCFPRCQYLAIDLAVLSGLTRHAVLELNAFGDLLPGITDAAGNDTYAAELAAALKLAK